MHGVQGIAFTNELRFARPRAEIFEAFLETDKWFQISYGQERLKRVVNDRRVGGQIDEDLGDGTGKLYGTIGWWDPPEGYSQTSQMLGAGSRSTTATSSATTRGHRLATPAQRVRADVGRDGRGN
jgi:hypothetical protein